MLDKYCTTELHLQPLEEDVYTIVFYITLFLFFGSTGFELRASRLLDRCSYYLSHSTSYHST
jgi:hypothetical protein